MSDPPNNTQLDKLGLELTQEELDQVKPDDWKLYLFWQDIQEITLDNYTNKDGSTRTGDSFGQGDQIIDRFEDRISEEYTQDELEYLERICEEYGFDQTVTAEMYEYLKEGDDGASEILNSLEDEDSLPALTVRMLLDATKMASRQRFKEYKEQE